MHDFVIRNALLLDGLGSAPVHGDLAVKDGKISEVGKSLSGKELIDASGLALMPGIIDNHTHYDAQITWDPLVSPSPALGVTTAIIGNCGFTIAPCRPADRELVMKNLTQVEGMSLEVLRQGIRWEFETIPQYFDMLERRGTAINIAGFVGHSSLRTYVMGEDAPRRAAARDEVARMRALLFEGMRAGAIGFATSTSPAHNGHGGLPMPSRLADDAEMRELVGALKEAGRGVFMLTKGGHTKMPFLEELAAASGRPVVIAALLHNSTNPRAVFDDLEAIAAANARGRRLVGAISCCPLSMDFTLHSPYTFEGLESWQPALPLKGAAYEAKLKDRGFRDAVRAELQRPAHFRLFNALLLNSDEQAVGEMLRHPASLVSLSDAGAHLTFFNDAGFGLHLLGHWVRERGALELDDAVRRLTSAPAQLFGIRGRGVLKPGYAADLMLFDPAAVGRGAKQRVFDLPGGHPRLTTPALGVHGVWVNGVRHLESLPGKVLRDFSA